ncbi:MAG: methyltransferase domain-containing protein [Gammaproteobacteria bacterium]|nr:methyltransferase domain-containing protein [Gammaproteobacteria bacterium]
MNTTTASKASSITIPDFNLIKQRQQATWSSGNYANVGSRLQIVGELLAEATDIRAGEKIIDVAAGNGNATLAAARRFAQVTSTDYVSSLLEKGAKRASANEFDVQFKVADAENLPFENSEFDVALSTFGVMFTPQQDKAANELLRVIGSGGRIGLANWTPEGFLGDLFRIIGRYAPPPAGVQSPMLWGSEPRIVELFGASASNIQCIRRHYNFRFLSATHWIDVFRNYYGPIHKTFGSLDASKQELLTNDLTALLEKHNIGGSGSLVVPSEYLEVVITKK